MPYSSANAVEIDRKLRDDFKRRVKDFGISTEAMDPVLAVLFRTFAQQIESLYAETGRIRLALLDELIAGLGIEQRVSRPSQTVIRLESASGPQIVASGIELIGQAQTGERITFRTDAAIQVSPARVACALVYRNGSLQLPASFDLPEQFQSFRPSLDPVRVNLGTNPALFLAIENLPAAHLSLHSFFFELSADSLAVQQALEYEPWCLVGSQGELSSRGVLQVQPGNAGLRMLRWLVTSDIDPKDAKIHEDSSAKLPQGFYGPRLFVMPSVPADRRFTCSVPRGMEAALARIFGRTSGEIFSTPRAWIRIGLPSSVTNLDTAINSIALHAVTASNVECINQTVRFDRQGTSIPISQEAGTSGHLVAPLSVIGEEGAAYLPENEPSPEALAGRFAVRNGRIELRPARQSDGREEQFANVRVWVTAGSLGNRVGPGQIQGFAQKKDGATLQLVNPASAAGGATAEVFDDAQTRFARTILSRDRIVTRQDLIVAVRAFDRRIQTAESRSALERSSSGLRRVQRVTVILDRNDFVDPGAESQMLQQDLSRHLQERMLYDTNLSLGVRWN